MVEPSHQYLITFCCHVTDGSRGAAWQNCLTWKRVQSKGVLLNVEKVAPIDIHWHLPNISRDQTVDVSSVRWWVVHFSIDDGNSGSPLLVQFFYFYFLNKSGMQALVNSWWKCIANGGDCIERLCFVAENFLYQIVLLCSLYLLQFLRK